MRPSGSVSSPWEDAKKAAWRSGARVGAWKPVKAVGASMAIRRGCGQPGPDGDVLDESPQTRRHRRGGGWARRNSAQRFKCGSRPLTPTVVGTPVRAATARAEVAASVCIVPASK
jgi:hypothetical protein